MQQRERKARSLVLVAPKKSLAPWPAEQLNRPGVLPAISKHLASPEVLLPRPTALQESSDLGDGLLKVRWPRSGPLQPDGQRASETSRLGKQRRPTKGACSLDT